MKKIYECLSLFLFIDAFNNMNARKKKKKESSLFLWLMAHGSCMTVWQSYSGIFFFYLSFVIVRTTVYKQSTDKLESQNWNHFERHCAGFFFSFSLSIDRLTCTNCRQITCKHRIYDFRIEWLIGFHFISHRTLWIIQKYKQTTQSNV